MKLLLKILLFLFFISFFIFAGKKPELLLIVSISFLAAILYLHHDELLIIKSLTATTLMIIIEIVVTSFGTYSYASMEFFTIPYWLITGWMFFSLITFSSIDDISTIFNIEKDIIHFKKHKYLLLIIEIASFPILILIAYFLWRYTVISTFGLASVLLIMIFIYFKRINLVLIIVSILIAILLEYAGIYGKAWSWNAADLFGLPLWVPFAYAYIIFITHRIGLRIYSIKNNL